MMATPLPIVTQENSYSLSHKTQSKSGLLCFNAQLQLSLSSKNIYFGEIEFERMKNKKAWARVKNPSEQSLRQWKPDCLRVFLHSDSN